MVAEIRSEEIRPEPEWQQWEWMGGVDVINILKGVSVGLGN